MLSVYIYWISLVHSVLHVLLNCQKLPSDTVSEVPAITVDTGCVVSRDPEVVALGSIVKVTATRTDNFET